MIRRLLFVLTLLATVVVAGPAQAKPFPSTIPLPVDFQPEGIATGAGSSFYVGSIRSGDIYRGDLRTGRGAVFVDAPAGRAALGLKVDRAHHLIFVAGGATGAAYVYSSRTGAPLATYQFATGGGTLLNDVVVTKRAAYFTDSFRPVLYKIPIRHGGRLGPGQTLSVSGPAATIDPNGGFNLNGIAATRNGKTLIVGHSALGTVFTVNPRTGASAAVAIDGLVPGTPDGILLAGHTLWVVENFANTVVGVTLTHDLSAGTITRTITSPLFEIPTTVAKHGDRLALVNAKFDLGVPPPFGPGAPPGTDFEVILVSAHHSTGP
jgi:sugar lactone lactonase YvrE